MRLKRTKVYKRAMLMYQHQFGFREPYQVLVDGTLIHASLQNHFPIQDLIPKTLLAPALLVVTPCVIHELGQLGKSFSQSTFTALKKYDRRQCRHATPISARECLQSLVADGNPNRYCIASQDQHLRANCRKIPGIPLIYMNNNVVILEPPSPASLNHVENQEARKREPTSLERDSLHKTKKTRTLKVKKRKGPAAPNPLSCKKPKTEAKAGKNNSHEDATENLNDMLAKEASVLPSTNQSNENNDTSQEPPTTGKRKRTRSKK